MNYELNLEVECPDAGTGHVTYTVASDVFLPLPYTNEPPQVGWGGCVRCVGWEGRGLGLGLGLGILVGIACGD